MSCSVCRREDVGAINAALRLGGATGTVRAVADRHGVGKSLLAEHRATCLKLEGRAAKAEREPDSEPPLPPPPKVPRVPDKTADKFPDKSGQERTRAPDNAVDMPRARGQNDPTAAKTFEERSLFCADMIAAGQWEGRPSVGWLMRVWGVEAVTVRGYHRAGHVRCALDRGPTAALLEDTLGSLGRQEREADAIAKQLEDQATDLEDLGELADVALIEARCNAAVRLRTTAAKYRDIALKARGKLADVGGLVKMSVSVSVEQDPRVAEFVDHLLTAIDALGDEIRRALAVHGAQNEGIVPALPDPREFVEEQVRRYVAGEKKELEA